MTQLSSEFTKETREIITRLLQDGSDPDALYIIEHHVVHSNFELLEKLALEAFNLGYEVSEAEEIEAENGKKIVCCDILIESELHPELIDKQQIELLPLFNKYHAIYEGWGTYFEDPNNPDID